MATHEHFFRYTSARWLRGEKKELALRYRRFDVDALKRVVMDCTGAETVHDMVKCGEGRFNRAFRLQLQNHPPVIARLPLPIAGPPHLVTSSEVATMDFLRNRLHLPVPRVLSWSSRASETRVGAEYIIMDVADGVELEHVWNDLTMLQKMAVVKAWFKFESVMIKAFSGGGYGNLYYRSDLPAADARDIYVGGIKDEDFVLGPSLDPLFWGNRHDELDIDRGSWPDVKSYLKALTASERAWISVFASPPPFPTPFELPPRIQDPAAHLRLLDQYDSVAEIFIPKDPQFSRPTMSLADSHSGNIFLSREALSRNEIEISAVIDWQHVAVLPLYLQAQVPQFIKTIGPPGKDANELKREQDHLCKLYHALYFRTATDVVWASALQIGDAQDSFPQNLPTFSASCWNGGYVLLKGNLIEAAQNWIQIGGPNVPCPLEFSAQEVAQQEEDSETWMQVRRARIELDSALGVDDDGWLRIEDYDRSVSVNAERRALWLASLPEEAYSGRNPADHWPYDAA